MLNSSRDKGSPCLSPRPLLNCMVGPPLTMTEILAIVTHAIMRFIATQENPIDQRVCCSDNQSTKSNVFVRSLLTQAGLPVLCLLKPFINSSASW